MKGNIFNLQRFCTEDGPGIRTTVFFKGCPLHCIWCHNPESHSAQPELLYNSAKCNNCGECAALCPNHCHIISAHGHYIERAGCVVCGRCLGASCQALSMCGYEISDEDVMGEVLRDKPFYDVSGGGITLSGGEPLFQPEFCMELLKAAKKNQLHICMETSGFASGELMAETAEYVDLYLYDCKETDTEKHIRYTGVDDQRILENLRLLDGLGKKTILRCPIIPGCNDRREHLESISRLADTLEHVIGIELEPYHPLGIEKAKELGKRQPYQNHIFLDRKELG